MKEEKIKKSIDDQIKENGFATVVNTFIDIGILDKLDYDNWRNGKVPYLEKVCKGNLNKLSETVKEIYKYSKQLGLKESFTLYKKYGKGKGKGKVKLKFSKTGIDNIEKRYATHFIVKH